MSLKKTSIICGISSVLLLGVLSAQAKEGSGDNSGGASPSPSSSPSASSVPGTIQNGRSEQKKAQNAEMKAQREQMKTERQTQKTENQEAMTKKLKERARVAIDSRINSLNMARTRLGGLQVVGSEYKSMINGSIDTSVSGLNDLKTSIENETDPAKLKELVPKITWDYRVYKTELPKDRGLTTVATAKSVLEKLNASIAKIEEALAKAAGEGVSGDKTKQDLATIKAQLAGISNDIDAAETEFLAMKPAKDTIDADKHLNKGKEYLINAKQKMVQIKNQLRTMVPEIRKAVKEKLGTPKPSASPSSEGTSAGGTLESVQ